MILLTSRKSPVYHLPHPREWHLALCGVRVRTEEELDNVVNEVYDARLCGRCGRLLAQSHLL